MRNRAGRYYIGKNRAFLTANSLSFYKKNRLILIKSGDFTKPRSVAKNDE